MRIQKKWWLAIAFLALTVGGVVGVFMFAQPTPGVTYVNFSRLHEGMTRAEVEAYLGKSNSVAGRQFGFMGDPENFAILNEPGWLSWHNDLGDFVSVQFDKNDRAVLMTWNGWTDDRTAWEKFRDRMPWIGKKPPAVLILID